MSTSLCGAVHDVPEVKGRSESGEDETSAVMPLFHQHLLSAPHLLCFCYNWVSVGGVDVATRQQSHDVICVLHAAVDSGEGVALII